MLGVTRAERVTCEGNRDAGYREVLNGGVDFHRASPCTARHSSDNFVRLALAGEVTLGHWLHRSRKINMPAAPLCQRGDLIF